MCWNVAQGYVLLFLPPWPAGSPFSFPFSLLFEQMGLGMLGEESHSVLINSPHTQTQLGLQGLRNGTAPTPLPLRPDTLTYKGSQAGGSHHHINETAAQQITRMRVSRNVFTKKGAYKIYKKMCVWDKSICYVYCIRHLHVSFSKVHSSYAVIFQRAKYLFVLKDSLWATRIFSSCIKSSYSRAKVCGDWWDPITLCDFVLVRCTNYY